MSGISFIFIFLSSEYLINFPTILWASLKLTPLKTKNSASSVAYKPSSANASSTLFYLIAGIVLIILGINIFKPLTELLKIKDKSETDPKIMDKGRNLFIKISKKSIYIGAFFLGILFSIGWAPCAISLMMPVFILILAQKIPILTGGLLLFVFGLGHGIPIIGS